MFGQIRIFKSAVNCTTYCVTGSAKNPTVRHSFLDFLNMIIIYLVGIWDVFLEVSATDFMLKNIKTFLVVFMIN